jgi:hypothetical protein
MYPGKLHRYADDLESFLHVLYFTLLRFSETNYKPKRLRGLIDKLFNESSEVRDDDNSSGGHGKASKLQGGNYIPRILRFYGRENLAEHLNEIAWMFKNAYIQIENPPRVVRNGNGGKYEEIHDEDDNDFEEYSINTRTVAQLEKTGAKDFQQTLREIMKVSVRWENDAAAKPAHISDSPKRKFVERLLERIRIQM